MASTPEIRMPRVKAPLISARLQPSADSMGCTISAKGMKSVPQPMVWVRAVPRISARSEVRFTTG
jgi:hypothetical protein